MKKIYTFKKRFILLTSTSSLLIGSALFVSSCSLSKTTHYIDDEISGLKEVFNPNSNENEALKNLVENIRKLDSTKPENKRKQELLDQKTILITAGGKINDKSFHQSAWEAISKFSKEIGNKNNTFYETKAVSDDQQFDAYDFALKKGFKVWVLIAFTQENLLGKWLRKGKNLERFKKENIKVVTVDWFPSETSNEGIFNEIKGNILGINFKTQEAAFVASYSAAQLLSEINKFDKNLFPSKKTFFNSFGGDDFSAITNFNYGFYEGMRQFNEDSIEEKLNYLVRSNSPIELKTGFNLTLDGKAKVEREIDGGFKKEVPQIIFPVAGALSSAVIDRVQNKKSNQWVIGIDSNQALAFPKNKESLLTSVEKKVGVAVYKALLTLYWLDDYSSDQNLSLLPNGYKLNDLNQIVDLNGKLNNYNALNGHSEGFANVSKSTLNPKLKLIQNGKEITYAQRYDEIVENTWDTFFGNEEKNIEGRFNILKTNSENGKKGLKPTDAEIKEFNDAMLNWPNNITHDQNGNELSDEMKKQMLAKNIKTVINLKNVLYGFMTFQNKFNYFDPIIELINNQK